jgi:hypothetical protein
MAKASSMRLALAFDAEMLCREDEFAWPERFFSEALLLQYDSRLIASVFPPSM